MSYKLSETSAERLRTCHEDLQKIVVLAIQISPIDFVIVEGHRTKARQQEMFKKGLSKIDGVTKLGKHNYEPSMAVDLCAYVRGNKSLAYDVKHLCAIGGAMCAAAAILLDEGEITHKLRWGANWDMDGEIITDQTFQDLPHFEIVK